MLHTAFRSLRCAQSLRLAHFSIQADHIHAIVEARDAPSLSRGMQSLAIRIAQGLNRLWKRAGRVFADRFHARALRTPREVRHALAYVLLNARKHGSRFVGIDPFSSGAAFDGWSAMKPDPAMLARTPTSPARTWLLNIGWRRYALIRPDEWPGHRRSRRCADSCA